MRGSGHSSLEGESELPGAVEYQGKTPDSGKVLVKLILQGKRARREVKVKCILFIEDPAAFFVYLFVDPEDG